MAFINRDGADGTRAALLASNPAPAGSPGKSNSLRATKSIAGDAFRLPSGSTATLAPTSPTFSPGFTAFNALMVATSEANDGNAVQDRQIVVSGACRDLFASYAMRRRIDEFAALDESGRLSKPRRIPE